MKILLVIDAKRVWLNTGYSNVFKQSEQRAEFTQTAADSWVHSDKWLRMRAGMQSLYTSASTAQK